MGKHYYKNASIDVELQQNRVDLHHIIPFSGAIITHGCSPTDTKRSVRFSCGGFVIITVWLELHPRVD